MVEERVGNLVRTPGGIWLGANVTSELDGITGYVAALDDDITGMCRVTIHPKSKDGTEYPKVYMFDLVKVSLVDEGISATLPPLRTPKFGHFDTVRDLASPFRGQIVSISYILQGCILYGVCGDNLSDRGLPPLMGLQEERLELMTKYQPAGTPTPTPAKPPGGPESRSLYY